MKLAVLFWFYKESDICLNRLELIRRHNPHIKIFGLFGGEASQAKLYRRKLGPYLDDFYLSSQAGRKPSWKWINGDLMILDWYQQRGHNLPDWDSVVVIQWDALVLGNIKQQLPGLKKNEIFISGVRVLDKNIERRWSWTKPGGQARHNYLKFSAYVRKKYGYVGKLLCSLFIVQVFPRQFFINWLSLENKELGMLEYKIPTYAKIFGTPFYRRNLGVYWFSKKARQGNTPLNARSREIQASFILSELKKKNGYRLFHPYFKLWEDN